MLFLLNDVVLSLDGVARDGRLGQRRFRQLPFHTVIRLGQELYAENPLLHVSRLERARRLGALISHKAPLINAALFVSPAFDCSPDDVTVRFANASFEVMADLANRQRAGLLDTRTADRQVWKRLAA